MAESGGNPEAGKDSEGESISISSMGMPPKKKIKVSTHTNKSSSATSTGADSSIHMSDAVTQVTGGRECKSTTSRSSLLPGSIDPAAAVSSFRSQRELLLKPISNSLSTLANSLYAQRIISREAYEKACNGNRGSSERGGDLLHSIETGIEMQPSYFIKVVNILESEPFLEDLAEKLVQSYQMSTYSETPADECSKAVPSAISQYRDYLKAVYRSSPISPGSKWPPTPSKEYIHLATAKSLNNYYRNKHIGSTLQGNIQKVLEERNNIVIEQILESDSEDRGRVVLVEGAPGIGKSTLVWELCRKWEEFACLQKYSLVVLLRLREEEVQKVASVSQLFYSCNDPSLADEVVRNRGCDILFILDGFDELPLKLQEKSFLLDLIGGRILPESEVLVTSRPSATARLLTSCRPLIKKHMEILGFTEENVEAYARSVFSSEPETLEKFKEYISASENPAINSLMYIPLNAAIIVEIYKGCDSDKLLPHTLTELYTQLCLTILNRHLEVSVYKFEDLPRILHQHFLAMSNLAYNGFVNEEIIFHSLSPSLVHFGFLDAVSALYGGGGVSYNFLHLTLQEFFAAYHISCLGSGGLEVFKQYGEDRRWNVVWRFVAGLTKFKHLGPLDEGDIFVSKSFYCESRLSSFFIECLFEAQTMKHCKFTTSCLTELVEVGVSYCTSAFDSYILGYCIANYLNGVPLCVTLQSSPLEPFLRGMETASSCCAVIKESHFAGLDCGDLFYYGYSQLHTVVSLSCTVNDFFDLSFISQLIPQMPNLTSLGLEQRYDLGVYDGLLQLLQQLCNSKVTSLDLVGIDFTRGTPEADKCYTAFKKLISLPSGKLTHLSFGETQNCDRLMSLVSDPSSLTSLQISRPESWISSLCSNTCITILELTNCGLYGGLFSVAPQIVQILKYNKTLLHLDLTSFKVPDHIDAVRNIADALSENSTLESMNVTVEVDSCARLSHYFNQPISEYLQKQQIRSDIRITWIRG